MRKILWIAVGVAVICAGCVTPEVSGGESDVLGTPVSALIKEYTGHRIRMFDADGKELKKLPEGKKGSVSVYNKDTTGQDNYIFGKDGVITKHLRSYGDDYPKGVWKEAK